MTSLPRSISRWTAAKGPCCERDGCLIWTDILWWEDMGEGGENYGVIPLGTPVEEHYDVTGSWTDYLGNPATVGVGYEPTEANSLMIAAASSAANNSGLVTVNAQPWKEGTEVKVVGNYVDANNYVFLEIALGESLDTPVQEKDVGIIWVILNPDTGQYEVSAVAYTAADRYQGEAMPGRWAWEASLFQRVDGVDTLLQTTVGLWNMKPWTPMYIMLQWSDCEIVASISTPISHSYFGEVTIYARDLMWYTDNEEWCGGRLLLAASPIAPIASSRGGFGVGALADTEIPQSILDIHHPDDGPNAFIIASQRAGDFWNTPHPRFGRFMLFHTEASMVDCTPNCGCLKFPHSTFADWLPSTEYFALCGVCEKYTTIPWAINLDDMPDPALDGITLVLFQPTATHLPLPPGEWGSCLWEYYETPGDEFALMRLWLVRDVGIPEQYWLILHVYNEPGGDYMYFVLEFELAEGAKFGCCSGSHTLVYDSNQSTWFVSGEDPTPTAVVTPGGYPE